MRQACLTLGRLSCETGGVGAAGSLERVQLDAGKILPAGRDVNKYGSRRGRGRWAARRRAAWRAVDRL